MAKLVLIEESVEGPIPGELLGRRGKRFGTTLANDAAVTVSESEIEDARAEAVIIALAKRLLPKRYYCHVVRDAEFLVAFPNCVVVVKRGDQASAEFCRAVGKRFAIPYVEMQFERMFEVDHPDLADRHAEQ
jgi:hypothetical protein